MSSHTYERVSNANLPQSNDTSMAHNIAIVSVAYNRAHSLARQIASLQHAHYPVNTTLIISIDKSDTNDVEQYARSIEWMHGEKRIVTHGKNLGLRAHMLSLGAYLQEFDAIIVLEDDVTVAPSFMDYAVACIGKYHDDDRIAGISLYNYRISHKTHHTFEAAKSKYDVYFMNVAMSWGQVWMKYQWEAFHEWYMHHNEEFNLPHIPENVNNWSTHSWLKYHIRYCIEQNKYFVYPYYSMSTNHADAGVHIGEQANLYQTSMQPFPQTEFCLPALEECPVRYDGFMEPKFLARYMDLDDSQLCVDLLAGKPRGLWKRYLLTTRILPYRILRSYGLQLSPIEANVILDTAGTDIFLYDTTQGENNPYHRDPYKLYCHLYRKGFYDAIFIIGPARICSLLWDLILYKVNKVFHTRFKTHIT